MRFVYLTSTSLRHTAFLDALTPHFTPSLIIREPKRPPAAGWSPAQAAYAQALSDTETLAFAAARQSQYNSLTIAPGGINQTECMQAIRQARPDVMLVFGASLLSPELLGLAAGWVINIHTGITQLFRGVESSFWAVHDEQPEGIGATVHIVDTKIDTGPILGQGRPAIAASDSVPALFIKSTQSGFEIIRQTLPHLLSGRLQPRPLPVRGRLRLMADMNEAAMERVDRNRERVLQDYLDHKAARDAAAPIITAGEPE